MYSWKPQDLIYGKHFEVLLVGFKAFELLLDYFSRRFRLESVTF